MKYNYTQTQYVVMFNINVIHIYQLICLIVIVLHVFILMS